MLDWESLISQGHWEQLCGLANAHKPVTHEFHCGDEPSATSRAGAEAPKSHRHISKCHYTVPQCLGMVLPAMVYVTDTPFLEFDAHCFLPLLTVFFYDCIVCPLFLCMHFLKLNLISVI